MRDGRSWSSLALIGSAVDPAADRRSAFRSGSGYRQRRRAPAARGRHARRRLRCRCGEAPPLLRSEPSAASLAELAGTADRFILAVFDTQQVEDVIEGPGGLLEAPARVPGAIYVSVSTCDPERIRALGERVAARGADAHRMSRCREPAIRWRKARASASWRVTRRASTISAIFSPPSASATISSARSATATRRSSPINLILGLNRAALAEGLVFAERLGLPLEAFLEVARDSAAYSQVMDVKGGKMIARDFTPHGKIAQSHKDFSLILDAAHAAGQELPLAARLSHAHAGLHGSRRSGSGQFRHYRRHPPPGGGPAGCAPWSDTELQRRQRTKGPLWMADLQTIDVHAHVLTEDMMAVLQPRGSRLPPQVARRRRRFRNARHGRDLLPEIPARRMGPGTAVPDMERAKFDRQVLSVLPQTVAYEEEPALALSLSQIQNEQIAALVKRIRTAFSASARSRCNRPTLR